LKVGAADPDEARRLFEDLEFGALAREFAAPVPTAEVRHTVVRDAAALERTVERLRASGRLAFNLERDHSQPMRADLVAVGLAGADGEAFYVPVAHRHLGAPPQLDQATVLDRLRPLFEGQGPRREAHNVKSDLILLRRLGWDPPSVEFDTMLASYLLDASRRSHALEAVARDVAGLAVPAYDEVLGSGARSVPISDIEVDRALISRFKLGFDYDKIYLDFDDTVICNGAVHPYVLLLLYQAAYEGKPVHLLTRHDRDIHQTLAKAKLHPGLFAEIRTLGWDEEKHEVIGRGGNSIFIDNAFTERKKVKEHLGIPVFDVDAVGCLLDWRS